MSVILNRNQEQESAMIMSAVKRYFGETPSPRGRPAPIRASWKPSTRILETGMRHEIRLLSGYRSFLF